MRGCRVHECTASGGKVNRFIAALHISPQFLAASPDSPEM